MKKQAKKKADKGDDRRVRDLAAKLAGHGFSAGMFQRYTADELAVYCLDVSMRIYQIETDDDNGDK